MDLRRFVESLEEATLLYGSAADEAMTYNDMNKYNSMMVDAYSISPALTQIQGMEQQKINYVEAYCMLRDKRVIEQAKRIMPLYMKSLSNQIRDMQEMLIFFNNICQVQEG
jgi:hypothetical protein